MLQVKLAFANTAPLKSNKFVTGVKTKIMLYIGESKLNDSH